MTKAKKRLLTLLLALTLAVGMAMPTFAATLPYEWSEGRYRLAPVLYLEDTPQYYLNVVGNHQVSQHRDVSIYTNTGSLDQQWIYVARGSDGKRRLISALGNEEYALNVYHPNTGAIDLRCDIMVYATNLTDSAVWMGTEEFLPGLIIPTNYSDYVLAVTSLYNNAPVIWHNRYDYPATHDYPMCWCVMERKSV